MKTLLIFCLVYGVQLKVAPGSDRVKRQSYGGLGGGYGGGNNYGGNSYGAGANGRANFQAKPLPGSLRPNQHLKPWQPYQQQRARGNGVLGCIVSPNGADNPLTPARQGQTVEIQCNTDGEFDSCTFGHYKPFEVGNSYGASNTDQQFKCVVTQDSSGGVCHDDSRISTMNSNNMCGVRVSNQEPDDTGEWTVYVNELVNGQNQIDQKTVTVYTFNQTTSRLVTKRNEEDVGTRVTYNYNWNTKRDEWVDGTGSYERLELKCLSQFGRPQPRLIWMINREEINGESWIKDSGVSRGRCYDNNQYVCDFESTIEFEINDELLSYLYNTHNTDTNPQSGQINFDLECYVKQGEDSNIYYEERMSTRIEVLRMYDNGNYTKEEIGMIVGITLGVLVLFIVGGVLLLIFAKSTERWCFADDAYQYRDPQDKRRPPSHAQVYSDDDPDKKQPKYNPNYSSNSSRKSTGTSTGTTKKQIHPQQELSPILKDTNSSKVINYELQVKSSASDSGHSSPSSSIDKNEKPNKDLVPTPLSSSKPRRPKSQHIPKSVHTDKNLANRLSYHGGGYDNMVVDNTQQVYHVTDISRDNTDNVTYADLDPKAFMIPKNKVLPTENIENNSSLDSRSTYASISSKPMYV